MQQPLTPDDVQRALADMVPGTQITFFDDSTATSEQAAAAIGCELGQIVKSLAFVVDDKPILVMASGDQRVETRKLAAMFDVGRKKVKVAKPEQCIQIYGYAPGGVPPIAHRMTMPIYIDDSLQRYEQVYAAAGAHNAIFPIAFQDLVRVTNGQIADVKVD